jgi:hypothetical protein
MKMIDVVILKMNLTCHAMSITFIFNFISKFPCYILKML